MEDNDWGISVPRSASTCVTSGAVRAAGYDIPGERAEENSVEAVYAAAERAVDRARSGSGPSLIEVHTLRLGGHFEGDPQAYRVRGRRPASLVPLDTATIFESVGRTGRLLVVDEDYLSYGVSGEIIAQVAERDPGMLRAPAARVCVPDVPIPYARPLEHAVLPTPARIRDAVRKVVGA